MITGIVITTIAGSFILSGLTLELLISKARKNQIKNTIRLRFKKR